MIKINECRNKQKCLHIFNFHPTLTEVDDSNLKKTDATFKKTVTFNLQQRNNTNLDLNEIVESGMKRMTVISLLYILQNSVLS